jgi:hypothetical protein
MLHAASRQIFLESPLKTVFKGIFQNIKSAASMLRFFNDRFLLTAYSFGFFQIACSGCLF